MSEDKVALKVLRDVEPMALEQLGRKRILFGHQSVGDNIIEGIRNLTTTSQSVHLNITDESITSTKEPGLYHFYVGENDNPESKVYHFVNVVQSADGDADIALFKFCFVDVMGSTDVERLFAIYRTEMGKLREQFPSVTFVHVTIPLTAVQTGPKAWFKRLMGRPLGGPVGGEPANRRRERYNELLRGEYSGREPIFDLAAAEATDHEGNWRRFVPGQGEPWGALLAEYTHDGGHLNTLGRKTCAERLLVTLAGI